MTPLDFALIVSASLSLHWIWNYEPEFAWWLKKAEKIKPIACSACNPMWIALLVVTLWLLGGQILLLGLSTFLPLRGAVWLYANIDRWTEKRASSPASAKPPAVQAPSLPPPKTLALTAPAQGPRPEYRHRLIIMTALADFRSSYSVAQQVENQARAIAMTRPDVLVQVLVTQTCSDVDWPKDMPKNVELRKVIPAFSWNQDVLVEEQAVILADVIRREVPPGSEVITHDLLFISWYVTIAKALHIIGDSLQGVRWWHVCHSLPASRVGVPSVRCTMPGSTHTIVSVASNAVEKFKAYYETGRVVHVPNIRDTRSLLSPRAAQIASAARLWDRDVVQILPVCSTRVEAKGVFKVIDLFAAMNKIYDMDSALLICNPNASGEKGLNGVRLMQERATSAGIADKVFLTSVLSPDMAVSGLPNSDISLLMHLYGNTFAFPSVSESDSLVLLEARLARQIVLLDGDSQGFGTAAAEIADIPDACDYIPWSSPGATEFAAHRLRSRLLNSAGELSRRHVLRNRNLEGTGLRWSNLLAFAGPKPDTR